MKTFEKKSKMTTPPVRRGRTPVLPSFNPAAQIQRAQIRQVLRSPQVQAKLAIGQPNDKYEQEADYVADEVMRIPEPRVQRQIEPEEEEEEEKEEKEEKEEEEMLQAKPLSDLITPLVQRQVEPEEEEEEEEYIQPKAENSHSQKITPNLELRIQSLKGGGQPLPKSERAFFEPRFGYDFSRVRVHSNPEAVNIAETLNAKAFTTGRDVVFGAGQYAPEMATGKRLLAHELTHVIQQFLGKNSVSPILQRQTLQIDPAEQKILRANPTSEIKEHDLPPKGYSPGKYVGHYKIIGNKTLKGYAKDVEGRLRYTERTYLIVEAIKGTWLSKITYDLGWGYFFPKEKGYGAYDRTVVYPLSVHPMLHLADWIEPGQRFAVLEPASEKIWMGMYKMAKLEGTVPSKFSRKWSWRFVLGGSVGPGVQADVYLLEIRNDRKKEDTKLFNYAGGGFGLGVNMPGGKSKWETIETDQYIEIEDFEGHATYWSMGLAYGYSELTAWNPKLTGNTKHAVVMAGWGFGPIGGGITEGWLEMRSGGGF